MKPYYDQDGITIYHGDSREVLPTLAADSSDLVLTDPPFGIGKAVWDVEFPTWWMDDAARIAPTVGVMPGNWNLLRCPSRIGRAGYCWTLAAHLTNGMTRGRLGFGNWIPCVVYKRARTTEHQLDMQSWCRLFGEWCRKEGIRNRELDAACGTSSMGDWWTGRTLPWCRVPSGKHWGAIRAAFNPPREFDSIPRGDGNTSGFDPKGDCRDFVVGTEPKPDHQTPKPLAVVSWFLGLLGGNSVLDPFLGSGTTLRAAKDAGMRAVGIDIEERYCEMAANRLAQEVLPFGRA